MVEVVFKVAAHLGHGEEVRVCGNVPALGCSSVDRALALHTSTSTYPLWQADPIFLPVGKDDVAYRYCIFSGGVFKRWELSSLVGEFYRDFSPRKLDKLTHATDDDLDLPEAEKSGEGFMRRQTIGAPSSPSAASSRSYTLGKKSAKQSAKAIQYAAWEKRSQADNNLNEQDGVVIVSYFLPVHLKKKAGGAWTAKWDMENILSLNLGSKSRVSWVGSVRYSNAPIPVEEEEAVTDVLNAMNCFPVFISQSMHHQFYEVFCKQHLWLLLHHVADVYGPLNEAEMGAQGQQDLWYTYSKINQTFKARVVEVHHKGDMVWIHGFHLMLLPSFLRRSLTTARIGYYFHTPFPSSELWRTMSRREDLLRGILAADQIGFHLYEYARHFLTTCQRLLGYGHEVSPAGVLTVNVDGREVAVTCIHVGIDLLRVEDVIKLPTFEPKVNAWRQKFASKVVVAGIDRLERLKGIPLKLLAIGEFMKENPQWRGKLLFTIIGVTATERGMDYLQTLRDVNIMVSRLNAQYATGPNDAVVYFEEMRDVALEDRLAFFAASDMLMITAPRDGLNRLPMEFTLARQHAGGIRGSGGGLIIMSEFISSARVMRGALTVNPWRVDEVKHALTVALNMGQTERADRFRRNLEFSTRLTTTNWALHVLHDLKAVEKFDEAETLHVGFGIGYKVMGFKAGFAATDILAVNKAYKAAQNRLILLDWGGTLVLENEKKDSVQAYAVAKGLASRQGPSAGVSETLEKLCADTKNTVFVMSGKELIAVNEFWGEIKNLGLGAEHGFFYRWPRDDHAFDSGGGELHIKAEVWHTIAAIGDQSWRQTTKMIMDIFMQRTHGTYLEEKGNALIWQFRDADPEFGFLQSKELEEHLKETLSSQDVEVLRGGGVSDGYIEVRPTGMSKGLFLEHAMSMLKGLNKPVDFVMAIGDDSSDEPMFEQINLLENIEELAAFGITVGKKPSAAGSYLDDPSAVLDLLNSMTKITQRAFLSNNNLALAVDSDDAQHKLQNRSNSQKAVLPNPAVRNLQMGGGTSTAPLGQQQVVQVKD